MKVLGGSFGPSASRPVSLRASTEAGNQARGSGAGSEALPNAAFTHQPQGELSQHMPTQPAPGIFRPGVSFTATWKPGGVAA